MPRPRRQTRTLSRPQAPARPTRDALCHVRGCRSVRRVPTSVAEARDRGEADLRASVAGLVQLSKHSVIDARDQHDKSGTEVRSCVRAAGGLGPEMCRGCDMWQSCGRTRCFPTRCYPPFTRLGFCCMEQLPMIEYDSAPCLEVISWDSCE